MISSKKAQTTESVLLLTTLVICVTAFFYVTSFEKKIADSVYIPQKLLDVYSEKDSMDQIAGESLRMAVQQAFADAAKKNSECTKIGIDAAMLWDENCMPSKAKIEQQFLSQVDSAMGSMNLNRKLSITDNSVKFESDIITKNVSEKDYNATYQYKILASADYPMKTDFESIANNALSQEASCKEKAKQGTDISKCMEELKVDGWTTSCINYPPYAVCTLNTAQNYFHDNTFSPVSLKFALRI